MYISFIKKIFLVTVLFLGMMNPVISKIENVDRELIRVQTSPHSTVRNDKILTKINKEAPEHNSKILPNQNFTSSHQTSMKNPSQMKKSSINLRRRRLASKKLLTVPQTQNKNNLSLRMKKRLAAVHRRTKTNLNRTPANLKTLKSRLNRNIRSRPVNQRTSLIRQKKRKLTAINTRAKTADTLSKKVKVVADDFSEREEAEQRAEAERVEAEQRIEDDFKLNLAKKEAADTQEQIAQLEQKLSQARYAEEMEKISHDYQESMKKIASDFTYVPSFTPDFSTPYVPSFTPDFSTPYVPSFTPDFSTPYVPSFTPDFSTPYVPSFTPNFSTPYVPSFTPDFSTPYVPSFTPSFSTPDDNSSQSSDYTNSSRKNSSSKTKNKKSSPKMLGDSSGDGDECSKALRLLGLSDNTLFDEAAFALLKANYRQLSRQYHPDKTKHLGQDTTVKFQELNAAFDLLKTIFNAEGIN